MSALTLEQIQDFLTEQVNEARKWAKSRRESAATWRGGDEASHEEGRLMAQRMSGRKMPRKSATEREEIAQREERIAAKLDREGDIFAAVIEQAESLRAQLAAREQEAIRLSYYETFVTDLAACGLCSDEPQVRECELESGPYCGTHDYFSTSDIEKARDLIKRHPSAPPQTTETRG